MKQIISKYKYPFIIVLLVLFNICVVIKNQDHYFLSEHTVAINKEEKKIDIDKKNRYKMKVYYPSTSYSLLNDHIDKQISNYISIFRDNLDNSQVQPNQYYTLTILYDNYSYKNYLSYLFEIEMDTGGAHPSHEFWSITYDIDEGKIVTLDDLINSYPNFLEVASKISREELLHHPGITDIQMLIDGTLPDKNKFSNFVFSDVGLLLFFPPYQVAPYSSGSFEIVIPYSKLNSLKIKSQY